MMMLVERYLAICNPLAGSVFNIQLGLRFFFWSKTKVDRKWTERRSKCILFESERAINDSIILLLGLEFYLVLAASGGME